MKGVFTSLSLSLSLSVYIDLTEVEVTQAITEKAESSLPSQDLLDVPMCLTKGNWLTDDVINAAQNLLKRAYPHVGGLQDTILAETLALDVQEGEFVQVLNMSGCHLITVSNIGCQPGFVNIYDSIPSYYVPTRLKEQIAAMLFSKEKEFTLEFQAVQSQRGNSDCGLFARFAVGNSSAHGPVPRIPST